jgi:type I restriction-modification system DNA methylase subunit
MHTLRCCGAGEFLLKAAKELEKEEPQRARELYLQGACSAM